MKKFLAWLKITLAGFAGNHCQLHAAGLTYFSMLALVPLLCVLLVLAKAVGVADFARDSVNGYLDSLIVNIERGQDDEIFSLLPAGEAEDREKKRIAAGVFAGEARKISNALFMRIENFDIGTFGWVGFAFLLWTVISSMGMVEVSFNEVWGVEKSRPPLKRAVLHPAVALAMPMAAALAASPQLLNLAREVLETVLGSAWVTKRLGEWLLAVLDWKVFRTAFSLALSSLVFAAFFKVMPNRAVPFRYALWGGALSALLFVVWIKLCAVAQVGIAKSSALYGSFAFFPIVLAWMFVSWEIVLLGANMVRAFECVCSGKGGK
jgi:membrane protein